MHYGRGLILASILVTGLALSGVSSSANAQNLPSGEGSSAGGGVGPDVILSQILPMTTRSYQNTFTGIVTGYAIGTQSCNIGSERIDWEQNTTRHPVIRGSMFRLKENRFEQIGISWVKHGFFATNDSLCDMICTAPGDDGTHLYPGCSDPYGASLNATQGYLGPASQINAFTGSYSGTVVHPPCCGIAGLLQAHNADVDPAQNPGARYYVEGQYIAADDAAAGNALNNASYQRCNFVRAPDNVNDSCTGADPQKICGFLTDFTHEQSPGIRAWQDFDPSVVETDAPVPGEGLFILAARATDLGTGFFHYEYALHNLNSDRSGRAFTVPFAIGSAIANAGFHDIEYHSGEPYDNTDWPVSVLSGKIIWSGGDYAVDPNANALRWGTMYNFRFDSNAPPGNTTVSLDLFKPGAPSKINISTIGPIIGFIDCNENGIADGCDVDCAGVGCDVPCGTSDDCNNNGVPDECENDCNNNGIADTCDLVPQGNSQDCNQNTVPDECEEDCNQNGIPDTCESVHDCDEDGVNDCDDLCPCSTPPNGCAPPETICCSSNGFLIPNYPYSTCLSNQGTPLCHAEGTGSCENDPPPCPISTCREGCLVGDGDGDGDFDLGDFNIMMQCYSGEEGSPAFVQPSTQCRTQFDYDDNGAVDLADLEQFCRQLAGPGGM